MMRRRRFLGLGVLGLATGARGESGICQTAAWSNWIGSYAGTLRFYRSIPLEDAYPLSAQPHVDLDDPAPFTVRFAIRAEDGGAVVWLRIDDGPMQTSEQGETLRFGPPVDGLAPLTGMQAHPAPRSASLIVRPDSIGTEALFSHADGSFWRRHFTARFTPTGADLIVWVFDAEGTRARTWRGSATKQD